MNRWKPSRPVIVGLVVLHLIVTAITFRDLSRRGDTDVRGSRRFWQVFTPLQMGNSALYWLIGRRRVQVTVTAGNGGSSAVEPRP